jgi:putative two-component system response regulator
MAVESPLVAAASTIEHLCPWPEGHLQRVAGYSAQLAAAAALDGAVPVVAKAALLHEIGKLSLPDETSQKPGGGSPAEAEAIKYHALVGAEMCRSLPNGEEIAAIVRHCHEHWNGQGYPDGLAGEQIPVGARIVAIADAFDTLTMDQPWRSAYSPEEALQILWFGADSQWDAHLIELFDLVVRPTLAHTT